MAFVYPVYHYLWYNWGLRTNAAKDGNFSMHNDITQKIAIPLVMTFSVMGILMKLLMKQAAGMDDYLKSRPVLETSWNKFLIIMNLDYWNWVNPVLLFCISCFIMPIGYAFLTFACFLCQHYRWTHAYMPARKAQGWEYKLPLFIGLLVYYIVASVFYVVSVGLNLNIVRNFRHDCYNAALLVVSV